MAGNGRFEQGHTEMSNKSLHRRLGRSGRHAARSMRRNHIGAGRPIREHFPCELLEQRRLLAVDFQPFLLDVPVNRLDVATGMQSGTTEPMVTVSDFDPGILAVSNQAGLQTSTDAGGVFTATAGYNSFLAGLSIPTQPAATPVTSSGGDTDTAFDADGRLFWTNLARTGTTGVRGIAVAELDPTNPNMQIGATSLLPNTGQNDDKQFLAADTDPLGVSPYRNNLYMAWTRLGGNASGQWEVLFSASSDGGVTWSGPVQISDADGGDNNFGTIDDEGVVWPADVAVAANGDVYVAYHAQPGFLAPSPSDGRGNPDGVSGRTYVARSTDGGQTFTQKTQSFAAGESDVTSNVQSTVGAVPGARFWTLGAGQPFVLVDDARPGNVYVVTNDDPNDDPTSGDAADVVISRSTDNGLNWTTSTISSGPNNSFQFFPAAAIDEFGNIAVAWYDNRAGAVDGNGDFLLDLFATFSTDGGLTWAPEFQVNDQPLTTVTAGTNVRFNGGDLDLDGSTTDIDGDETYRIGEYLGIDLFGGTAYVTWNGNTFAGPNPVGHQAMFDAFAIRGRLTVQGDDNGAPTDDLFQLRRIAGNTDFIEVLVNGQRQYAGLLESLFDITFEGLEGNDRLIVDFSQGDPTAVLGDVRFDGGLGIDTFETQLDVNMDFANDPVGIGAQPVLWIGFGEASIAFNRLEQADLSGGPSANRIDASGFTYGAVTLSGLSGDDTLLGGSGADRLLGGTGADRLEGRNADDLLIGGIPMDSPGAGADLSDDTLFGGRGNDVLIGDNAEPRRGAPPDDLSGGVDQLFGGDGDDRLYGQGGLDALEGGFGADSLYGGHGNDIMLAGAPLSLQTTQWDASADFLEGGFGNDLMYGDSANIFLPAVSDLVLIGGNDTLLGGDGNDTLHGQAGDDEMEGGLGSDSLLGGNGNDAMVGGTRPSLPLWPLDFSADFLDAGAGNDVLLGDNGAAVPLALDSGLTGGADTLRGGRGNDSLYGQAGNDQLEGQLGDDLMLGGRGNDILSGGGGVDVLFGEQGADYLLGGSENDRLEGGSGHDVLHGNEGDDNLAGGDGADILLGWDGSDFLGGGNGRDVLIGGLGRDRLEAEDGEDILIGGITTHDANDSALLAILAEWNSPRTYLERVQNVIDGTGTAIRLNGLFFLSLNVSVLDDGGALDELLGGPADDWFLPLGFDQVLDANP